ADPQDAYAYSSRAHYYDSIGDKNSARADMRQWSGVQCLELPRHCMPATPRDRRRVIHLPFDCELVFSAERPVNAISTMSIAFGQKGRCEMKLFEIPMFVASLFGLGLTAGLDVRQAHADFTFGERVNLKSVIPVIDTADGNIDCFSYDGLEVYTIILVKNLPGQDADWDLCVQKRASTDAPWGPRQNLEPVVNSTKEDTSASISADGLVLCFSSNRAGGYGYFDVYMTTRASKTDPWGPPTNLGPTINSSAADTMSRISADGLELYFASWRSGGYGDGDIYVAKRATVNDPWAKPVNLGPTVNSAYGETQLFLSSDGLLLLFADNWLSSPRPGAYSSQDIWMTRRASLSDPWEMPVNLGSKLNGPTWNYAPRMSVDGRTFYYHTAMTLDRSTWHCWQVPIIPIVDFDGDGKVNEKDLDLLMADWGKSNSVCDIGPFAWGDGVVDEQDLRVLMESLVTPGPKASDVLCDGVLSWLSPSFAQACDVYLGTSPEAVNTASRTNPQNVLVSQGQTATTYDPPARLEFSQTYYWRVDFVISGVTPAIYQGPVLKFTTAAQVYPIQNVTATASSASPGCGAERTVDGSGLDKNDGHSIDQKDMWWSTGAAPNWIRYEFDRVYHLYELWVWNFNSQLEPYMGFGARTVKIEYSTDGTAWKPLADVPEFKKAPGKAGYTADTKIPFGGVPARFVKLTIEKNWGVAPQTGLSEVRFFAAQSAAATQP
ncbi:MAG: hypothetical protein FJ280_28720, partial [Planctomycetes bacterium]|nr:hypothetical protein [Planctomycetota bacterium]